MSYAVAGGNAVAAWVSRVDEAAVRNTQDVDLLLVRMKLTSFRDKDRTHLRDLIDVGLIGPEWCGKLAPQLAGRLQQLIDTPEG